MNKRKPEENHAFFPLQKLENITKFLQSAKVTKKKTGEYQKNFLENWRVFWIFPKFLLWGLQSLFFG
jgi:hypothetical protein